MQAIKSVNENKRLWYFFIETKRMNVVGKKVLLKAFLFFTEKQQFYAPMHGVFSNTEFAFTFFTRARKIFLKKISLQDMISIRVAC